LIGQYLLRELLQREVPVCVLARNAPGTAAEERVRAIVDAASESLGRRLPLPRVAAGDLRERTLGLGTADRAWLAAHCNRVLHAAASTRFTTDSRGEPAATNLDGTRHLAELCQQLGLEEFHHVSTAYVCGRDGGAALEDESPAAPQFRNDYEQSKYDAERLVRARLHATVYRPSIVVGHSQSGHTSTYFGVYPFLELAGRLAERSGTRLPDGRRRLALRLPGTGDERLDLVPVDWVARAIATLCGRPACHGRTFHLTARSPVMLKTIRDACQSELRVCGIRFAGCSELTDPTSLEQAYWQGLREYRPYLAGDPVFDRRNTQSGIPDLPPPEVDRAMLERLIRFAVADHWGRRSRRLTFRTVEQTPAGDCAVYLERFFPEAAPRSSVARVLALNLTVGFDIAGPGGGQWSCRWIGGELRRVERGLDAAVEVTYHTDPRTFRAVVAGQITPQAAFFERRIEISGDIEKALKLAVLFAEFVREFPFRTTTEEGPHAAAACA
jgi:thioester reductase-like protein